jgi:thymidylate synthase ThyX
LNFEAKVIEDSISQAGVRLTTLQLRYPRFIHAEFMTHRVFSRNASSSRAIPVAKMISMVRNTPAMPIHWGANRPGMQAREELPEPDRSYAIDLWTQAAEQAADIATAMEAYGLHKQVANRILEPFQWMSVIVTSTEWVNWDELRDHEDAEPNIRFLAGMMKQARADSKPVYRSGDGRYADAWHLPYITWDERMTFVREPRMLARASAARCARVSFLNHDGSAPVLVKDLELADRLVGSRPLHASPVEHQARPMLHELDQWSGNFRGWHQFRKSIEMEMQPN